MGIASFFPWFRKTFSKYIFYVKDGEHMKNSVDNVMVDMNGIFHPVAQRVFRYGKYGKPMLAENSAIPTDEDFFAAVGKEIDMIVALVNPTKRVILCVDGVAPVAKQIQQRQRRYKADPASTFDSNSLTPGSQIMTRLCNYLDDYIKKYSDRGLEVVFSSSSVPGEGEMKLISFLKHYSGDHEVSAIYGLDADIILLSLSVPVSRRQKIYVVRERDYDHTVIDVDMVRKNLTEKLRWSSHVHVFDPERVIFDFIFMCFLVGNDFIKRAPGVDILTGSIDMIIEVYRSNCAAHGHITNVDGTYVPASLMSFLYMVGENEHYLFAKKVENIGRYITDDVFNRYVQDDRGFDTHGYRKAYYANKLTGVSVTDVCTEYLEGIQWVLLYYTGGTPSWKWYYPYNYSPFISDVAAAVFKKVSYGRTVPYDQLYQLLLVVPPRSMDLLPVPLNTLYKQFPKLFPTEVVTDASGKRHAYEAEVILPAIDDDDLLSAYKYALGKVSRTDLLANTRKQSYSLLGGAAENIQL